MPGPVWRVGDKVVHAGKPEWGSGEVRTAEQVVLDGKPGQRLTVRFDRAGVKTLATQYAEVREAGTAIAVADPELEAPTSALAAPELVERMTGLPDEATDPFRSRRARLQTTLGLYRFTGTGGSLLDWAAIMSGMNDPLSRFNRHELEELFRRFRGGLDANLKRLVQEIKREDPGAVAELAPAAPADAQQALRRLDALR